MSAVMDEVTVAPSRALALITRFNRLRAQGASLDYDRATLALEIREEFPPGENGGDQFRRWVTENLKVRGKAVVRLENLAAALKLFPDRQDWADFGGATVLIFLTGLTVSARNRLVGRLRKRVAKGKGTLTPSTVRKEAKALGILTTRREGGAGGNSYKVRFNALADFVRNLKGVTLPRNISRLLTN